MENKLIKKKKIIVQLKMKDKRSTTNDGTAKEYLNTISIERNME